MKSILEQKTTKNSTIETNKRQPPGGNSTMKYVLSHELNVSNKPKIDSWIISEVKIGEKKIMIWADWKFYEKKYFQIIQFLLKIATKLKYYKN